MKTLVMLNSHVLSQILKATAALFTDLCYSTLIMRTLLKIVSHVT